ncbi:cytochrome P450 [Peniophora sp. CONT]|nr:cytochrome P450 [Peniophora sp. CONT]
MALLGLLLKLALAPAALVFLTLVVNGVRGILSYRAKHRAFRAIRGPMRTSFIAGNLEELYSPFGLPFYEALPKYGSVVKVHGLFGDVLLCITDPRAISHILVQNANNYPAADVSGELHMHRYLLGPGLLGVNGPTHKRQRKLLNPVFSHAQMRRLVPLMRDISHQLKDLLVKEGARSTHDKARVYEIDTANWFGRVGLEMIAQAGFGHTFHALTAEGDGDEYVGAVKDLIPSLTALGPMIPLFMLSGAASLPPRLLRVAGDAVSLVLPPLRRLMRIVDLMNNEIRRVCEERQAVLKNASADDEQNDILGVLLQANGEGRMPDVEICANSMSLVMAGTETTSTTLCRILHMLALHPEAQVRLRRELAQAFAATTSEDGSLGYEALMALPYLDALCKETLRVFAPAPYRHRRSIKEDVIPLEDGTSLHIPANTEIVINIHCLNTDKTIWGPDAREWRPERWLDMLPQNVSKIPGVWGNSLSFGGGPKSCIGLNFSLLEMKSVLATLVPAFRFTMPLHHEIEWRFGTTMTPSVKGEKGLHPLMPLGLEIISSA